MVSKVFPVLALAAVAVALPGGSGGSGSPGSSQCTTSTPQCCQNVQNSNTIKDSSPLGLLLGLLGVVVSDLNVPIGTGCTPIDVLGGVQCNQNTVCCGSVYAPQLIGINCVPITLNL